MGNSISCPVIIATITNSSRLERKIKRLATDLYSILAFNRGVGEVNSVISSISGINDLVEVVESDNLRESKLKELRDKHSTSELSLAIRVLQLVTKGHSLDILYNIDPEKVKTDAISGCIYYPGYDILKYNSKDPDDLEYCVARSYHPTDDFGNWQCFGTWTKVVLPYDPLDPIPEFYFSEPRKLGRDKYTPLPFGIDKELFLVEGARKAVFSTDDDGYGELKRCSHTGEETTRLVMEYQREGDYFSNLVDVINTTWMFESLLTLSKTHPGKFGHSRPPIYVGRVNRFSLYNDYSNSPVNDCYVVTLYPDSVPLLKHGSYNTFKVIFPKDENGEYIPAKAVRNSTYTLSTGSETLPPVIIR